MVTWRCSLMLRSEHVVLYKVEVDEEGEADALVEANDAIVKRIADQAISIAPKQFLELSEFEI
jgi:hypothetical protein